MCTNVLGKVLSCSSLCHAMTEGFLEKVSSTAPCTFKVQRPAPNKGIKADYMQILQLGESCYDMRFDRGKMGKRGSWHLALCEFS